MATYEKLLARILSGRSNASINFDELRNLLIRLGFQERVRQVRAVITRYKLGGLVKSQIWDDTVKSSSCKARKS
ncbi:MAG: hypothetical protein AB1487_05080 [Thermodesulfobacteriota bacterium]